MKNKLRDYYTSSHNFTLMMGWTYNTNGDSRNYYGTEPLQKYFEKTVTSKAKREHNINLSAPDFFFNFSEPCI